MTHTWADFVSAEPRFAETVRRRFEQYTHHVLATLRKDGSPRVTGLEVFFRSGELWLGMMPNSRKAQDLLRDPRFAVHANPGGGGDRGDGNGDGIAADGDVRVGGRAVEVSDESVIARFVAEVRPPLPFHLFRVELTEVVQTRVEGEDLVVRVWQPGRPLRTVRRGNDDSAPREDG
ncbi:pyridoxamine 5'-phosphate oxidase family protein [Streptomyces sp. NPDC058405]|uniref:pyridoxamine 5'-phosphate oxidase family protein n=1 Tax=Streptomyces sp. NPDC058405 TaxID=3346482 RepID=UPI00364DC977